MRIVQIGSNRGYDNLTNLIGNNEPELLVLVEPFEKHNESLKKCYEWVKNLYIENIAIIDDMNKKEIILYYHNNDTNGEVSSIYKEHIMKHHSDLRFEARDYSGFLEQKTKCITVNELLDKYNIQELDILYIDTEGLDSNLIKSIDFKKFNIKKIYFEYIHMKDNSAIFLLKSLGYKITNNVFWLTSLAEK